MRKTIPTMQRANPYFLKTSHLGFRRWSLDDLPLAVFLWGDAQVTRLLGGPFSLEQIRERLDQEIATMSSHHIQYWPIFLLTDDEHVGCAGLRPYRPDAHIYELGIHLRPAYWGQGLAVEAGQAVIRYAFEPLGAKGLFAGHHPANEASRKVIEQLGFRFTQKEFYAPTGLEHPSYMLKSSR